MCALLERQFISSEDGTTPTVFYKTLLLLFPQMMSISVLHGFFSCKSKNDVFMFTCNTVDTCSVYPEAYTICISEAEYSFTGVDRVWKSMISYSKRGCSLTLAMQGDMP